MPAARTGEMRIYKGFAFDAAHSLPHYPRSHANARLHGHSFQVRVIMAGAPDPVSGQIADLDRVAEILGQVRKRLDHMYLNDIEGLSVPTLENLAWWIWQALAPEIPALEQVDVRRDSRGEGCSYRGPEQAS